MPKLFATFQKNTLFAYIVIAILGLGILLTACDTSTNTNQSTPNGKATVPSNNSAQPVTYSTDPNGVVIRTFYGGGIYGTLEMSPDISIYGNGDYILGPGLDMQKGNLTTDALQSLLHTLVDTYGLLGLHRQQFYDIQDANATLLELSLNGKRYEFLYGQYGNLHENAADMDEYHRLGKALTTITESLSGPTSPYSSNNVAFLVHRTFSPDLNSTIPAWSLGDFTLIQTATYECGPIIPDETSPNAELGCLRYLVPDKAVLLTSTQYHLISGQLGNRSAGTFLDQGLYYNVSLRPLLPDELPSKTLAMFGSQQLTFKAVPLESGPIPGITPTP